MINTSRQLESPWPHRWALALACATFPMIWIGGLVTTTGAGMAVPDWPNTYGYNLFLYPLETWVYGPWKLFIEHGHRLFGTVVGMLAIGLVASSWRCESRTLVRWLAVGALVAVIAQGALGGMRVLMDEVQLAKIHGCVGPAFFAYAAALAAITSRRWQHAATHVDAAVSKIERLAILTTFLAYCQLVLGAQLRHLPAGANPGMFRLMLLFHLVVAAALVAHVLMLALRTLRAPRYELSLVRPGLALAGLVLLQVALGISTWAGKYGWPAWMGDYGFAARHVVRADSNHQVWMITAHVATGSLILVCSLVVALRAGRLTWQGSRSSNSPVLQLEAAR